MAKNQFGKSKEINNAYATYRVDNPSNGMYFEWKILKTYQVSLMRIKMSMLDGLLHVNRL